MKRFLPLAAITLAFALQANAASLGKWTVHRTVAGSQNDVTCTFSQKDTDLTGSCVTELGTVPLTGKLVDKTISWQYVVQLSGQDLTVQYSGKIEGMKASGTVQIESLGLSGDFTATPTK